MDTLPVNTPVKPPKDDPSHISLGIAQWIASLDDESRGKLIRLVRAIGVDE